MTQKNRSQWDAGRFFQTLAYFDIIPGLGWLRQLLQSNTKDNENKPIGKKMGVILVAGATGGVGKRVVQKLIDKGYQVRSLVRVTMHLGTNDRLCLECQ